MQKRPVDVVPAQFAVDEPADHEGIGNRDDRCLGRRENAAIDAAKNDDGGEQRQGRAFQRSHKARSGERLAGTAITVLARQPPAHGDEGSADQEPRQDAGHEHVGDRHIAGDAIEDHRRRGRYHDADRAAGGGDRASKPRRVAALDHRGDHDGPDRGNRCGARAADRREEDAGEDRHAGQAARDIADQHFSKCDQPA